MKESDQAGVQRTLVPEKEDSIHIHTSASSLTAFLRFPSRRSSRSSTPFSVFWPFHMIQKEISNSKSRYCKRTRYEGSSINLIRSLSSTIYISLPIGELQKQVPVHEGGREQQEKSPEESQNQGILRQKSGQEVEERVRM